MIRLIALDLDGTLLGPDFRVSEADGEAVRAARERGATVALVTSRWYGLALRTAKRLELTAPLVCHNGAHIREPDNGRELLHLRIEPEAAREIAALCDEFGYETYTTVEGITYMRTRWEAQVNPERLPKDMRLAKRHAGQISAPVTGIIVFGEDGVHAAVDTFAARYAGVLAFSEAWNATDRPYVTITAAGADKGTGLRFLCDNLGIPAEETMAMGDAAPDLDMFEVAKLGIAMGNAPDEVKAQADAVAPSNTEGGVAWAIERYVLEES